jgi:2-oxopent-4-enoate hydratase
VTSTITISNAVARLDGAATSGIPCAPVRELIAADDIAAAYEVQTALIERRIARGARRVGRKIGLTSAAVQHQLDVNQPDFGVLLSDMVVAPGGTVPAGRLLQPRVEGEVAFLLRADLDGPLDRNTVRAAVATAHAAIEIVDSRVRDWDIRIADTVADNASSGMFVVSATGVPLTEVEPVDVTMELRVNGEVASSGDGSACLGDPLNALEWLARTVAGYGVPLRAGELILSGALGPLAPVGPGDTATVTIGGLGDVSASFGAG